MECVPVRTLIHVCCTMHTYPLMRYLERMGYSYITGDRNTVNSCCTISILKNPQQFAWGWEIRHQTSKNRRILHESACMLAGGCTPKWAQFRRPSGLAVPTVLLSEKYSCTDHVSTIAKHFPYGTSVCSSLTSENFGQNRYRKSSHWDLVCPIQ